MKPHEHNAANFEHWHAVIQESADGDCVLLLDVDTAILRPLDDIWDRPFDLAYTVKRRPFPFNLGVLFVRVSPAIRTLFAAWFALILQRLADPDVSWRRQYGGINQASFGHLLEDGALADLQVVQLPCAEWNCEESGWPTFDPAVTRILHVKGLLRRTLFRRFPPTPETVKPLAYYRDLEARALLAATT